MKPILYVKNRKILIRIQILNEDETIRDISTATEKRLHFVSPRTGALLTKTASFDGTGGADGILQVLMDPWFFTEFGDWTLIPELLMPEFDGCTEEVCLDVRKLPHGDIRKNVAA